MTIIDFPAMKDYAKGEPISFVFRHSNDLALEVSSMAWDPEGQVVVVTVLETPATKVYPY